jgi:hypothetical protein
MTFPPWVAFYVSKKENYYNLFNKRRGNFGDVGRLGNSCGLTLPLISGKIGRSGRK